MAAQMDPQPRVVVRLTVVCFSFGPVFAPFTLVPVRKARNPMKNADLEAYATVALSHDKELALGRVDSRERRHGQKMVSLMFLVVFSSREVDVLEFLVFSSREDVVLSTRPTK